MILSGNRIKELYNYPYFRLKISLTMYIN